MSKSPEVEDLRAQLNACRAQNILMEAALQLDLAAAEERARKSSTEQSVSAGILRELFDVGRKTRWNFVIVYERGSYRVLPVRAVNPGRTVGTLDIIAEVGLDADVSDLADDVERTELHRLRAALQKRRRFAASIEVGSSELRGAATENDVSIALQSAENKLRARIAADLESVIVIQSSTNKNGGHTVSAEIDVLTP